MKHITRTHGGWLFRRSIAGQKQHQFFSDLQYGSKEASLEAAEEHGRKLNEKYGEAQGVVGPRSAYALNRTGIVGVAWTCRADPSHPTGVRHLFRGQVSLYENDPEKRKYIQKSFSVTKHGLWNAYRQAAEFRFRYLDSEMPSDDDLIGMFVSFLDKYLEEMLSPSQEAREMLVAFMALYTAADVPKDLYDRLPSEIALVTPDEAFGREAVPFRMKP